MSNYDKLQWQAEQAALDQAMEAQREKQRKARERSARNARRKLERLHRTLSEKGVISDFENEFGESVVQRLDEYGAAFHNLEKGRPGDALSFAQKRVMAAMNKKAKDLKKQAREASETAPEPSSGEKSTDQNERAASLGSYQKRRKSSFKPKAPRFTPRMRNVEDDIPESAAETKEPYIPPYEPTKTTPRPFLRLVK